MVWAASLSDRQLECNWQLKLGCPDRLEAYATIKSTRSFSSGRVREREVVFWGSVPSLVDRLQIIGHFHTIRTYTVDERQWRAWGARLFDGDGHGVAEYWDSFGE